MTHFHIHFVDNKDPVFSIKFAICFLSSSSSSAFIPYVIILRLAFPLDLNCILFDVLSLPLSLPLPLALSLQFSFLSVTNIDSKNVKGYKDVRMLKVLS